ncbi:hypothetical protein [Streptomyces sp. NPDC056227]|uniref:hypothetical protein n=1 Tax=Streptomyces sp. NPDC056227 TaxID=3345753 RepID=UPI0035D9CFEA
MASSRASADKSLNRAYDLWSAHREGDRPDWLGLYGEAQLKSTEGKIMLRTGYPERATSSLAVSVEQAVPRASLASGRLAIAGWRPGTWTVPSPPTAAAIRDFRDRLRAYPAAD